MLATDILHLPAGFYLLQYPDDLGLSESTFLRYCGQPFGSFADLLAELRASLPDYSKGDACIFDKVGGGEVCGAPCTTRRSRAKRSPLRGRSAR
ncbi:protein of unknown function [Methylococcus capsulatus]|uniref:Uncharacterized protein n=1 Tax=Methylococcus capsulatus TaxID=414 RepID=A0AA35XZK3_METCP|nr:protein of unknown function [Methylococcus capsulatus]